MRGAIAMYDYRWKKGGVAISAVGLAAMIAERLHAFIIFKTLNAKQHYGVFQLVMLLGLFVIAYCREKYDDDRARLIRAKSFQIAFSLMSAVAIGISFTATVHANYVITPQDLALMAGMGIVLYLYMFYIGLYFDFLWEYDDRSVMDNLRNIEKNKWGIIVYLAGSTLLFALLCLL